MIVFGARSVQVNSVKIRKVTCGNCGTKGLVSVRIFRKHFHIFWIPMFPIYKHGSSECQNCKNVLEPKEMPQVLKGEYKKVKSDSGGPYWQFVGLVLVAIFALYFNHLNEQDEEDDQEYLSAPLKGDVYFVRINGSNYTCVKVREVSHDSVFVSPNMRFQFRRSKVYFINKPENYLDSTYGIARKEVLEMYDSDSIYDILRSKNKDI